MLELLQEKNNQKVVLIKTGVFYIATGNDGEYHKEKRPNQNCLLCSGLRRYSEDKYMNAFRKMVGGLVKYYAKNNKEWIW